MTYRMTVVLEYPNVKDAPQINARTRAKDLGEGEVVAVQFADALLELEVVEEYARRCDWDAAQNDPRLIAGRRFPSPTPVDQEPRG
jgi:hypothetical protein